MHCLLPHYLSSRFALPFLAGLIVCGITIPGFAQTELSPLNRIQPEPETSPNTSAPQDIKSQQTERKSPTVQTPNNTPATNTSQQPLNATPESSNPSPAPTGMRMNPARLVIQAMMRILVNKQVFPADVYESYKNGANPEVTRAAFADILLKALGHNTQIVSEFPVYRDVSKDHWAYAPIEVARERKLLTGNSHGYFRPDVSITREEGYMAIARTLPGKNPTLEMANNILSVYSDVETVPESMRPDLARMVNANIIIPRPVPNNKINIKRAIRYGEFAGILSRELEIKDLRRLVLPVDQKTLPQIPSGLIVKVVPNGAIFKNRLAVGDPLYFSLTEAFSATVGDKTIEVPRGTRLDSNLSAINNDQYIVSFSKLQMPDGEYYQIHGDVLLTFDPKELEPFIVPGEPYTLETTP